MKTFQDSEAKLAGLNYLVPLYAQDSLKQQFFINELDSVANAFPKYVKSLPENLFVRQYLLTKGLIEQMPKTVETYKWRAGYEIIPDLRGYALGTGVLQTVDNDSASGLGYGAAVEYRITSHVAFEGSYKTTDMRDSGSDYSYDTSNIALKFNY